MHSQQYQHNMNVHRNPQIKFTQLFINNEWVNCSTGKTFETKNPATGETIAKIQEGDKHDIDRAVTAAKHAFKRTNVWRTIDASMRGQTLWRLADLCERDLDYLCSLETVNNGKPIKESRNELLWAVNVFRYYAGYADKFHGNTIPADGQVLAWTRKEPIGVCGLMVPWYSPFYMMAMKMAPALAAGNTIVIKPADQTPLTALYLAHLCKEAGFPPGVVNVVPGFGRTVGTAMCEHNDVRMISFTGRAEIGKLVQEMAAKSNLKRVTLETGGKSPFVVFDDADIEMAAMCAHKSLFLNVGHAYCPSNRVYVHEKVYDRFVQRCVQMAEEKTVGDPFDINTQLGPQVDDKHVDDILKWIEMGRKEGARLVTGGKRVGNKGYFIQPTIFMDVTDNMTIAKEEIFGPIQCIFKFKTLDEVIDRCNDSDYGLFGCLFTQDVDKMTFFIQAVRCGHVWVNTYGHMSPQTPFGGYKQSGFGREAGEEGMREYFETKSVVLKTNHKMS